LEGFGSVLGKLSNLSQLIVYRRPVESDDIAEDTMLQAAEKLATLAAPKLRYIRVAARSWRIMRWAEGDLQLVELDTEEEGDVELFGFSIFEGGVD